MNIKFISSRHRVISSMYAFVHLFVHLSDYLFAVFLSIGLYQGLFLESVGMSCYLGLFKQGL